MAIDVVGEAALPPTQGMMPGTGVNGERESVPQVAQAALQVLKFVHLKHKRRLVGQRAQQRQDVSLVINHPTGKVER